MDVVPATQPLTQPLVIAAAPNGAYKTRREHRQLPVTAAQLAVVAAGVARVGARMLHLHVRAPSGKHTLAAAAYQAAIQAIRARVGEQLFIQVTSEAAGRYSAAQQRQAIYALSGGAADNAPEDGFAKAKNSATRLAADGISIAVCELLRAREDFSAAKKLLHHLARQKIGVQYILYSTADIAQYADCVVQRMIPQCHHTVLLVVGKPSEPPAKTRRAGAVDILHQMLDALYTASKQPPNWMTCAFGAHEFECLTETTKLGGHVRVGFENSLHLKNGEVARDNTQLVAQIIEAGNPQQRPLADAHQARKIIGG